MSKPMLSMEIVITGPVTYTPGTPEQVAAYEERCKADIVGYPRILQARGEITKEEADERVRLARIQRNLNRRRRR